MRHVLSAIVQNVPGVLAHISGMLASRGYNIDSLAVGETDDPHLSRMTFVVVGDNRVLEQVRKQLEKIDRKKANYNLIKWDIYRKNKEKVDEYRRIYF